MLDLIFENEFLTFYNDIWSEFISRYCACNTDSMAKFDDIAFVNPIHQLKWMD